MRSGAARGSTGSGRRPAGSLLTMTSEREPVPEADALEQQQAVVDEPEPDPELDDPEAPEADALEQGEPVPFDEDDAPR